MGIERFDPAVVASLADARKYMCSLVEQLAKVKRNLIIADFSPGEMSSWPIKRAEAMAYQSGTDMSAPNLTIEAAARGVTLADLVAKVMGKADVLAQLEAQIAGVNGKHQDAIKALSDYDALADYDYQTGWPV